MTGTLRTALIAVVVIVLALAVAGAYFVLTDTPFPWVSTEAPTRFLVIAGSPDDTGAVVAQVIAVVDTSATGATAGAITALAPETGVTIPGTNYNELKDALPFGGGAAVAEAYAQASHTTPLPYIAIPPAALTAAIDGLATVQVEIPAPIDIFDGDTLYSFPKGTRTVTGAEFAAILKGRPYLNGAMRERLDASLAAALVHVAGVWPGGLDVAVERGEVQTNVVSEALGTLGSAMNKVAP